MSFYIKRLAYNIYKLATCYFTSINPYFPENSSEITRLIHLMKRAYNNRKRNIYRNTKKSFKYCIYENDTELSKYVCSLKHKKIDFKIYWEVIKRAQPIADGNNPVYRLCIKEATTVVYALTDKNFLNKKSEFMPTYRHIKKSLLNFS